MTTAAIEHSSGKGAGDENFPVGSWLLPRHLRRHVAAFYAFARAADDIADAADLAPDDKLRRLDRLATALEQGSADPLLAKAEALRLSLAETGVAARHPLDLISAFQQDSTQTRYADWAALMDYCNRSAAPVGRYLLDLHGENRAGYPASDALCNALQVLNHLQDCGDDYRALNRVYLPLAWLDAHSCSVTDLAKDKSTPGLQRVLDQCVTATADLVANAKGLPPRLTSRALAAESAAIVRVAEILLNRLSRQDPLATRVKLNRLEAIGCLAVGVKTLVLGA